LLLVAVVFSIIIILLSLNG